MKKILLFVFVASFLFTLPGHCQWGTEPGETVTLASGEGEKYNVLIEPGPDNSWYVTYTAIISDSLYVIHLARVTGTGVILWDNIIQNPTESGNPKTVMISDNADGVIMAWTDYRNPVNPLIYANRIDPDGNKLWGADDLKVGTSEGEQHYPRIILDGDGGVFITCYDRYTGNGEFMGIYAYRVSSEGSVLWRTYLFPNGVTLNGDNYSMNTDGEGGLIAFGILINTTDEEYQIRGMRLDENGTRLWPNETLGDGASMGMYFQGTPAIGNGYNFGFLNSAFHPAAGVYLVYNISSLIPFGNDYMEEKGQLIDINGNKLWAAEDVLLAEPTNNIEGVDVLTDLDGNLYFNYGANVRWRLQKVLSDGSLPWTIDGVEYSSDGTGQIDKLELTASNDVMVPMDGIDDIINVARIDGTGDMVYDPPLLAISLVELGYQQVNPVIRVNENDQVIAVWAQHANTDNWDLKMHGFNTDGLFGSATSVRNLQPADVKMYPNPISNLEKLVIETSEIEFGNVSLIHPNGKVVFLGKNMDLRNGATLISLPNELSAGIYFLQISNGTKVFSSKLVVYE
ncbi:T9SS type A sorting domain-containing protein [Cryomorpha ignava]|uniref:T9SS type A sorting domain-containing protein n=1 Tax=Cryomorpha ignava TaxID=101383 RepID=A0A7K3WWX1_9FLAO|nr:T9SS type A sorting domain-containing protein [Cryomorpha ignava]NEN25352.1 T9SS type A sorting domain-containing protein [Cryomorpha ignava]